MTTCALSFKTLLPWFKAFGFFEKPILKMPLHAHGRIAGMLFSDRRYADKLPPSIPWPDIWDDQDPGHWCWQLRRSNPKYQATGNQEIIAPGRK
jgi:hypothetical protein